MILFDLDDAGGQEQRKRTKAAGCPFTGHVKTRRPQRLLLRCWRRMLMVRLHEWAGLWRVVILREFVLLDCGCEGAAVDEGDGGCDFVDLG